MDHRVQTDSHPVDSEEHEGLEQHTHSSLRCLGPLCKKEPKGSFSGDNIIYYMDPKVNQKDTEDKWVK